MKTLLTAALLFGSIGTIAVRGQSVASGSLLVLAKAEQMLAIVDPTSLKVLGRVPSGPDPHEVVASNDGRTAYISNYNGGGNIITVVDLVGVKPLPAIDLGPLRAPHGLAFAGGKLRMNGHGSLRIAEYRFDRIENIWPVAVEPLRREISVRMSMVAWRLRSVSMTRRAMSNNGGMRTTSLRISSFSWL